jgi:peptidyl-prolyl cis-trans isomerase SurA
MISRNRMRLSSIALLAVALASPSSGAELLIDGVHAIVNEALITYKDVREMITPLLARMEKELADKPQELQQHKIQLVAEATDQLIEHQLILYEYASSGHSLPETLVDDIIQREIKKRYGDRTKLLTELKERGISFEAYRRQERERIIDAEMRNYYETRLSKDYIVSPQKITDFYEANKTNFMVADQVKLRVIVLNKPAGETNGATRKRTQEILGLIRDGAAFDGMAKAYSQGSQREDGGLWGWVDRPVPGVKPVLSAELGEVVFKLKKGECSGIIELPTTCCLALVEDIRSARLRPLTEVRDEIERELLMKERARLGSKWLGRLKQKSFTHVY